MRSHVNLGQLCARLGHLDKAAAHLKKAIELEPTNACAHSCLGQILGTQGDHSAALQEYEQALRYDPRSFDSYFGAGMIYKSLKQYPEAVEMLREAVKLEPQNSEAYKQLAATSALAFFVARGARSTDQIRDREEWVQEAKTACR